MPIRTKGVTKIICLFKIFFFYYPTISELINQQLCKPAKQIVLIIFILFLYVIIFSYTINCIVQVPN